MLNRTMHRGAYVSQPLTFKGAEIRFDGLLVCTTHGQKPWQVQHRANNWLNAMCPLAMEMAGRSSYRNRQAKKGAVTRYGVQR